MLIGILALQGDFASHAKMLSQLNTETVFVRTPDVLEKIDGLIIPGGESTTIIKFLKEENFLPALTRFFEGGKPILGTCAGAIILAGLNFIDISVERNAYGRQVASKIAQGEYQGDPIEMVLIRAPRITRVGQDVKVLATLDGEAVCVQQATIIAATFHTELTTDTRLHNDFLKLVNSEVVL